MLRIKQATLSRRVSDLEHRLGIKLFERTTRGAMPTQAGTAFISSARRILGDIDELQLQVRAIRNGEAGELTIGFSTSLASGNLRFALVEFQRRYPDIRLNGLEGDRGRLNHALHSGQIDFAIVTGQIGEAGLCRRPLWSERIMVALPEGHALEEAERIYWSDLRHQGFVLPRHDPGPDLVDLLRARLSEPGYAPDIETQNVSRENVLVMVSAGWFLTLVPESALGVTHPGIVLRDVHELTGQTRIDYCCYWRSDNHSPALRRFLGLIRDRYPE